MALHRDRFPGLADGWARLDGPAGSLVLDDAAAAVHGYLTSPDVSNVHGSYAASERTDALVAEAREEVAALLGGAAEGLVFGPSATALLSRLSAALEHRVGPGDEVLVTELDHDANVSPWLDLAARTGAAVRTAPVDEATLELPTAAVADRLDARTKVVAITAASNLTGTRPDVGAVVEAAHAVGAFVVVAGVHAVPHDPAMLSSCGADAVVCSAYKWFGPHVSALSVRPEVLGELRPPRIRPAPASGPEAWERGSLPFELLPGVTAAARFLRDLDWTAVAAHETALADALVQRLDALDGVAVHGRPALRTSTVAFSVEGRGAEEVAGLLAEQRIAVGAGTFYAVGLLQRLGLDGVVRAGALQYTSAEDVDRLVEAVAAL